MKLLISAAVGTVILFVWFALSWVALPIHTNALKYTEGQDEIIEVLAKHLNGFGARWLGI
ncbi:MAG: hypothetical protein ACI959_002169 [Limisphaerales bacterium]|jgi:hypothetical protein